MVKGGAGMVKGGAGMVKGGEEYSNSFHGNHEVCMWKRRVNIFFKKVHHVDIILISLSMVVIYVCQIGLYVCKKIPTQVQSLFYGKV